MSRWSCITMMSFFTEPSGAAMKSALLSPKFRLQTKFEMVEVRLWQCYRKSTIAKAAFRLNVVIIDQMCW